MRWWRMGKITVFIVMLYIALRTVSLHHLEPDEIFLTRGIIGGKTSIISKGGWNFTNPFTWTARVPTSPMRVCITSSGRGVNCKLVRFNPDKYEQFLETEGFRLYWWANRFSFNWGYDEEYRGIRDIFRGYAFAAQKYSFITVTEEYNGTQ